MSTGRGVQDAVGGLLPPGEKGLAHGPAASGLRLQSPPPLLLSTGQLTEWPLDEGGISEQLNDKTMHAFVISFIADGLRRCYKHYAFIQEQIRFITKIKYCEIGVCSSGWHLLLAPQPLPSPLPHATPTPTG